MQVRLAYLSVQLFWNLMFQMLLFFFKSSHAFSIHPQYNEYNISCRERLNIEQDPYALEPLTVFIFSRTKRYCLHCGPSCLPELVAHVLTQPGSTTHATCHEWFIQRNYMHFLIYSLIWCAPSIKKSARGWTPNQRSLNTVLISRKKSSSLFICSEYRFCWTLSTTSIIVFPLLAESLW